MNVDEYAIMRRVEDTHWWYETLRDLLRTMWAEYAPSTQEPVRLLDAGCGTGANLALFAATTRAVGIDFAPEAVHFCRERDLARTAVASVDALPFDDGSFDVMLSCDVLCNRSIHDKLDAMNELARCLRPGGTLFLNLPAYQWLWSSHDAAVHTDRRFTMPEIETLLLNAGLTPVFMTHWNTLLFPAIVVTRLVRRWTGRSTSDLDGASEGFLDRVFRRIMRVEQRLLQKTSLPFGLSIFAVATKN